MVTPNVKMGRGFLAFVAAAWRDRNGGVLVFAGLALPVLLMMLGGTVNIGLMMVYDTRLQTATDAAALAVAKELQLSNEMPDEARAIQIATAVIADRLATSPDRLNVKARLDPGEGEIEIIAEERVGGFILGSLLEPADTLTAVAAAKVVGKVPVCVVGLDESSLGTIQLLKNARMTGNNCAVYSNSNHPHSIKSKDSAMLHASLICSAGGKDGEKGNFDPLPLTDCPVFEDPLMDRPEPDVGACTDHSSSGSDPTRKGKGAGGVKNGQTLILSSGDHTLSPGVYCGGLRVEGSARVRLEPGLYVIKNGPLEVADDAQLSGDYTSFYLTGQDAHFDFSSNTTVSLGAMNDGILAGLLFFEDRTNTLGQESRILSNNTRNLLGTIYLSRGRLFIGADAPVADESAYTAIIAQQISLDAGPNLVLNTDYSQTDVPVPDGIFGSGSQILLTR